MGQNNNRIMVQIVKQCEKYAVRIVPWRPKRPNINTLNGL